MSKTEGVLVATDVPPDLAHPNGFSGRLHHFLASLCRISPVDLLGIGPPSAADLFVKGDLPLRNVTFHPAPTRPIDFEGPVGKAARLGHYLLDPLPYMSRPRRVPGLNERLRASPRPLLFVTYLPHLAHLSFTAPTDVPVVCVLEEALERLAPWKDLSTSKRVLAQSTEAVRVKRLYRRVGSRSEQVVLISEPERDHFKRLVPPNKLVVIPHGIDCNFFAPGPSDDDGFDVGVFGDLGQARNSDATLALCAAAARSSSRRIAASRWGFIGRGSDEVAARAAVNNKFATGTVPDVRPHYRNCQVVVVPATSGTGVKTTVLQAWAMGRCVVASRFATAGLPAVPGGNLLVADSPDEIISKVQQALESPDLRSQLASEGRRTVVKCRHMDDLARRFATVCSETMSRVVW